MAVILNQVRTISEICHGERMSENVSIRFALPPGTTVVIYPPSHNFFSCFAIANIGL